MDLHHIREDYSKQELSEQQCHANPLIQFEQWLNEAIRAQVNEQGFVFFSNYLSRKGQALDVHPYAALTFFWAELERQVRIEGCVEKLSTQASDEYFASRPYTSRLGAWASEQSSVIADKNVLIKRAAAVGLKHPLHVPRPPHWGGYVVIPERVEFWQGRPSRLHDRIQYRLQHHEWLKERLAP